jgi:hypothetical protein
MTTCCAEKVAEKVLLRAFEGGVPRVTEGKLRTRTRKSWNIDGLLAETVPRSAESVLDPARDERDFCERAPGIFGFLPR